jgi:mono/diheme cytochrome c family protein
MKKRNLILYLFSASIISMSFYQTFSLEESIKRGKSIYEANCLSCHMANGEGIGGVFPPLVGTDNLDNKNRMVQVVLKGVKGPIEVKGEEYNGEMTGFDLSDKEVADLLNYIRNSWGNKGEVIVPGEIQAALKADVENYQSY